MKHQKLVSLLTGTVAIAALGAALPAPALAATRSAQAAAVTVPGGFVPLSPARALDTRNGTGAPKAKVASQGTLSLTVSPFVAGGVPGTNVAAVVVNVTVTNTTSSGFLTVFPGGAGRPTVSNLNFAKAQTVANLVTVGVGTGGAIQFYNGSAGTVDVIADVAGYYLGGTPVDGGTFVSLSPTRILDTRHAVGGPTHLVGAGATQVVTVGGGPLGGVPADAKAVVLNVTATNPTRSGHITAFPTGTTLPTVSNLNYTAGRTVPNMVTVGLGTGGKVSLYNGSAGTVNLIADVAGYYLTGTADKAGAFVPVTPKRILDTRSHLGSPGNAPIDPQFDLGLQTIQAGGVPLVNVGAVAMNVTATAPTRSGFITVSPTDPTRPTVSNLNHAAGQTIANMAIVPPGLCSKATFYNGSSGTTHVLADVAGYFLAKDATGPGSPPKTGRSWGDNGFGDLGDGTVTNSLTPVNMVVLRDVKGIDSGNLAVTNDGTVFGWGPDMLAQLYGDEPPTDEGYFNCSIPEKVPGLNAITAVAGSGSDGYALDAGGNVWSWGFNESGQLGDGTTTTRFTPAKIPGLTGVTAITAGFALKGDGTVWGWGDNTDHQLGTGVAADHSTTPVQIAGLTGVSAIAQGVAQYALVDDGLAAGTFSIKAWGSNFSSALGDGSTFAAKADSATPVFVSDVAGTGHLSSVTQIDGGIAVAGGTVVTWGLNDQFQLGNGNTHAVSTHPIAPAGLPVGITQVAAGGTGAVVLATDGTVWTWGAAIGNGRSTDSGVPFQMTGLPTGGNKPIGVGAGFDAGFAIVP